MKRAAFALLAIATASADSCSTPQAVKEQRTSPFFRLLVEENVAGGAAERTLVRLLEDNAGNCYIAYGEDGGIYAAPPGACQKAREELVERPAPESPR